MPISIDDWEPVDDELRFLRGFSYVPTYTSLFADPPPDYDPFLGVGSATTMWALYDPAGTTGEDVRSQLKQLRRAGINTVRVFLSFPAWEHDELAPGSGNAFLERFAAFLELCGELRLRCIPVLWDGTLATGATDPVDASLLENLRWHHNPGRTRIESMLRDGRRLPGGKRSLRGTPAEDYLLGLVGAAEAAPPEVFLGWSLMNEPALPPKVFQLFLAATLEILDDAAPDQRTLLNLLFGDESSFELARDPRVDVLDIHPYGPTRAAIEAAVWDASHVPDPDGPGGRVRKPIVATEIGIPGEAQSYVDAFAYARGVPREDLGPGETGVGFLTFLSHICAPRSLLPLQDLHGMFYADGEVREVAPVRTLVDAAIKAGLSPEELFAEDELEAKAPDEPDAVAQAPVPLEFDAYHDTRMLIEMPVAGFASVTFPQYLAIAITLRFHSNNVRIADLSSAENGNPWGPSSDRPGAVVTPEDRTQLDRFGRMFIPEPGADLWPEFAALLAELLGAPFDPANQQHVAVAATIAFTRWREVLRPYFLGQGGPY